MVSLRHFEEVSKQLVALREPHEGRVHQPRRVVTGVVPNGHSARACHASFFFFSKGEIYLLTLQKGGKFPLFPKGEKRVESFQTDPKLCKSTPFEQRDRFERLRGCAG